MTAHPEPVLRCASPKCGRGHYLPVPFCPYCGTETAKPTATPVAPPITVVPPVKNSPPPAPTPPPAPPVTPIAPPTPGPAAPAANETAAPAHRPSGFRKGVLALVVLGAVAGGALIALRKPPPPPLPPPVTLKVGPSWMEIDLAALSGAPFAAVTATVPLRFRTDGQRLQIVQPGGGIAIHTSGLRRLEVRTVRGNTEVTFTPREK